MEKKSGASKKTTAKKAPAARESKATAKAEETREAAPKAAKAKRVAKPKKSASGKACKVKSCKREYRAKGYCKAHYRQWRHGKFAKARYTRCHDYGCTKPMATNRHGFCDEHFTNYYIKGMEVTHAPVAAPEAKPEKTEETAA